MKSWGYYIHKTKKTGTIFYNEKKKILKAAIDKPEKLKIMQFFYSKYNGMLQFWIKKYILSLLIHSPYILPVISCSSTYFSCYTKHSRCSPSTLVILHLRSVMQRVTLAPFLNTNTFITYFTHTFIFTQISFQFSFFLPSLIQLVPLQYVLTPIWQFSHLYQYKVMYLSSNAMLCIHLFMYVWLYIHMCAGLYVCISIYTCNAPHQRRNLQ